MRWPAWLDGSQAEHDLDRAGVKVDLEIAKELDARGLNCPLPILRAKKALNDMQSGQILRVLATDPSSPRDFQAFARQTGNELVRVAESPSKEFEMLVRRR
jgi:TusA-related sulfurtransferase